MFDDCPKFDDFRARLEARGYQLRALWSGKTHPDCRYENVALFQVRGTPAPKVSTLVVQSYGAHGFGVWVDTPHNDIAADIAAITGTEEA